MKPIDKAINIISAGNKAAFAKSINEYLSLVPPEAVTSQQVNNWTNRGDTVPSGYCPAIEALTAGAVNRQELRPRDWRIIWPELAAEPPKPGLIEGTPIDGKTVREAKGKFRDPKIDTRKLRE